MSDIEESGKPAPDRDMRQLKDQLGQMQANLSQLEAAVEFNARQTHGAGGQNNGASDHVFTFGGGTGGTDPIKGPDTEKPGMFDVSEYINLIVPVYYGVNDRVEKSAAIAASLKYWIKIDESYSEGTTDNITLETGAAWGTPDGDVTIWRVLETDAAKMATFHRPCWAQANPSAGIDLRAMDVVESSV